MRGRTTRLDFSGAHSADPTKAAQLSSCSWSRQFAQSRLNSFTRRACALRWGILQFLLKADFLVLVLVLEQRQFGLLAIGQVVLGVGVLQCRAYQPVAVLDFPLARDVPLEKHIADLFDAIGRVGTRHLVVLVAVQPDSFFSMHQYSGRMRSPGSDAKPFCGFGLMTTIFRPRVVYCTSPVTSPSSSSSRSGPMIVHVESRLNS